MKCPLPSFYRSWPSGEISAEKQDCIKEECAWWDKGNERCAILILSDIKEQLSIITYHMGER